MKRALAAAFRCAAGAILVASLVPLAATIYLIGQELGLTSGRIELVGLDGPLASVLYPLLVAPILTLGSVTLGLWAAGAALWSLVRSRDRR